MWATARPRHLTAAAHRLVRVDSLVPSKRHGALRIRVGVDRHLDIALRIGRNNTYTFVDSRLIRLGGFTEEFKTLL